MSLGKRKGASGFMPIIKYDARSGEFSLQDRVQKDGSWTNVQTPLAELRAIFDLEMAERGWINFPKAAAPEMLMVPAGEDPGEAPSKDHREGFRLIVKVLADDERDSSVREFLSTAIAAWAAVDRLHDVYERDADKHAGQLPVVELVDVIEIKNASGTSFQPALQIVDWVDRPADMPKASRGNGSSTHRAVVAATADDFI
jgi:hypothetical protein